MRAVVLDLMEHCTVALQENLFVNTNKFSILIAIKLITVEMYCPSVNNGYNDYNVITINDPHLSKANV